jgi:hypothetical protein
MAEQVETTDRRTALRRTRNTFFVVLVASLIAIAGARPFANSWNDGSRLASVESLVDRGTWIIDDSIFVKPQPRNTTNPYSLAISSSPVETGTLDKVFVHGHFYSDKPPVSSLYLAGVYWLAKKLTHLDAVKDPHVFIYLMTLASSGFAYVISVLCLWLISRSWLITASFALATIVPIYSRQVNNHILQLAVTAGMCLIFARSRNRLSRGMTATLGLLAGLGYTLDLGIGPGLVLATLGAVSVKNRNIASVLLAIAMMLPCAALHHWINFKLGGSLLPINANPAYFEYPGSPFSGGHISGHWLHNGFGDFILYVFGLWIGKRGLLLHDPALFLLIALPITILWRALPKKRAELVFSFVLVVLSWATYAIGSTNYGGLCTSVRWFVPLLAPLYMIANLFLDRVPNARSAFITLSALGLLMNVADWVQGPFADENAKLFWIIAVPIYGAAIYFYWNLRQVRAALSSPASR